MDAADKTGADQRETNLAHCHRTPPTPTILSRIVKATANLVPTDRAIFPESDGYSLDAAQLSPRPRHIAARHGAPLHRQLCDQLRELILEGAIPAGSRLPSIRAFAGELAISRNTVITALDQLAAEGLLESRRGSGTHVSLAASVAQPRGRPPGDTRSPSCRRADAADGFAAAGPNLSGSHRLPSRHAGTRRIPVQDLEPAVVAARPLRRRGPVRLPLCLRPSGTARGDRQLPDRDAPGALLAGADRRHHRRPGGARPARPAAGRRRRYGMDGGARLSRRPRRVSRRRRQAVAAAGQPRRLAGAGQRRSAAAADLSDALLPASARHHHAARAAAGRARRGARRRRLDHRGRFRRRIHVSRPAAALDAGADRRVRA